MEKGLFGYIWKYSRREQIIALALTLVSFPFLYYSFDLPKTIINKAIDRDDGTIGPSGPGTKPVDVEAFGLNFTEIFGFQLEQFNYLFLLCGLFLAFVVINGAFKMRINTYKGIMAERLLRRLRYILIERTLRFPLPQFQKTSSGEVVTMVSAEVEPLGGFFGDAFALVAFQGGTFLTIVAFLFVQDWRIGVAATALVPVQGYIIPKMQRKINLLGKERVTHVRSLSNRVGEVVGGIQEVHAHDNSEIVLADVSSRLGRIFWVRFEIFQRKFFMKFVNNFINQMTPFLFYSIGGYLAIVGELSVGALVAALAAYKDLASPWKELLNYYQRLADAHIKYDQLTGQFAPVGMLPEGQQRGEPEAVPSLKAPIRANGLSWSDEDGVKVIDNASFTLKQGSTVAFTSASGTAKEIFSRLMARILMPTGGRLQVGDVDLATLHEGVIGRRIGFLAGDPMFFNGTIADNIFLGLKHAPPDPVEEAKSDPARASEIEEAKASGNSPFNSERDWISYETAGVADERELTRRTIELLDAVEMVDDMYSIGLRQTIDPDVDPELTAKVLEARRLMADALKRRNMEELVQIYDFERYNTYSSVAGNILFGKAVSEEWEHENWPENEIVREMLKKHELDEDFYRIGLKCAELMVDLFKDVPPGHPFFEQYSFVSEDLLPELRVLLRKAKQSEGGELTRQEKHIITGLPFRLTVQRHRLGLIDEEMQARIIALRKDLRDAHPEVFVPGGGVEPYDPERLNKGMSILDNILFGRIVHGRADAADRVHELVEPIVAELSLKSPIIHSAFDFQVGIGGGRLSLSQRQKLNIVRNAIKRPDILIANEATSAMDGTQQQRLARNLCAALPETTQIHIGNAPVPGIDYDRMFEIRAGRISETDAESGKLAAEPVEEAGTADEALGAEAQSLQELPLFTNLDQTRLKFLAFTSERLTYKPGEILMHQGDEGDAAYVILDGTAEVVIEGAEGEQVLFELGKNQLVGELALLCDTKRSATVRAQKEVVALKLSRDVFAEMARQDSYFAFEMTRDLGRRLILTTDELNKARTELAHRETASRDGDQSE